MAYHALYRKYRPTRFGEVIGQEHITAILKNQIKSGHIAHAYLFSGSRGTGKTTTARILARAINCLNPAGGEPCGECEACGLSASDSIDIIEMDAASNSKVDEMRALLDKAEFAPVYLKTKVYIIDEAHMLSKSANNALLKTLEEPPAHVVFILATTEPQSLPKTILSRCQRFDFRRLSVADMVKRTGFILNDVGAAADDEALMCIARAADGAMRDCLSIADQCLSFCGNNITLSDVLSVLGSMSMDFIFGFAESIINSDAAAVMKKVDAVIAGGRDIGVFVQDLSGHFRSLLLAKLCGECADILECTGDAMAMFIKQAKSTSKARLERALGELMQLQSNLRSVTMPRVLLESVLLRICHPEEQEEAIALADRVEELEKKLREGNFVPAAGEIATGTAPENAGGTEGADNASRAGAGNEGAGADSMEAKREQVPEIVSDSFEIPPATGQADELYQKFMAELMNTDIMLGIQMQLASAHWCDAETLYLCFDKSNRSNYNYANASDIKAKLIRAAAQSIAPRGIELVLKDGSAAVKADTPRELFGIAISEE